MGKLIAHLSGIRKEPRKVINQFFKSYDLSGHLWYVDTWLDCVNINDYWRGNCPSDLLVYCNELGELITAAYFMSREKDLPKTAVDLLKESALDPEEDLLHPSLFFGWQPYGTLWDFFPRSLSREEYVNPYLAISGFFNFKPPQEWQALLYDLLIDGLSGKGIPEEILDGVDLSPIRKHLHKLIEAAHLIDVRENRSGKH